MTDHDRLITLEQELADLKRQLAVGVHTSELSIVDDKGRTRASLRHASNGEIELVLHDTSGQIRAQLGVADDGSPGIFLSDSQSETAIALNVSDDGEPFLLLKGPDKKVQVGILVTNSSGKLSIYDSTGEVRVCISGAEFAESGIAVFHAGKPCNQMSVSKDGEAGLFLYQDGERIIDIGIDCDGSPD